MATEKDISIELDNETAQGSYSNLAIITHSSCEFIIDFIRLLPGIQKPKVTNRILMTPENAKRLLLTLQENINKFEKQNGEINLKTDNQGNGIPLAIKSKAEA